MGECTGLYPNTPTPMDDATDDLLITALADGDERALATLMRRHSGCLFTVANSVLNNPTDAEDVVQTVWARLWQGRPRIDPTKGTVLAFLASIAKRRAIDIYRVHQSRARTMENYTLTQDEFQCADPDTGVSKDLAAYIEQHANFTEGHMAVWTCSVLVGMSQAEGAAFLGIPRSSYRTRAIAVQETVARVLANMDKPEREHVRKRTVGRPRGTYPRPQVHYSRARKCWYAQIVTAPKTKKHVGQAQTKEAAHALAVDLIAALTQNA